jgi:hypothetical protein
MLIYGLIGVSKTLPKDGIVTFSEEPEQQKGLLFAIVLDLVDK